MSTQYSTSLRFWEGQQNDPAIAGNWGTPLSSNFTLLDSAITGTASVNIGGLTTYSLTTANGAPDQSREKVQDYIGALSATCTVTLPNVPKIGWARNDTTGGHNVIETAGAGTTITLPPDGYWYFRAADGATNVAQPNVAFGAVKIGGTLQLAGTLKMPNTTPIQMQDTGGTYRDVLFLSGTNSLALVNAGGGSFLLQNQAETISLLVCDNSGNLIVHGFQTINGTTLQTITGWEMNAGGTGAIAGTSRSVSLQCPSGGVVALTVDANSDKRIKSDIQPITPADGEAFVLAAKPSTYLLNGARQSGFIAQDIILAGYPHMVGSTPREGLPELDEGGLVSRADVLLTLSYNDTIAYLAAALKSALARIAALEQARA